ncbi:MAG: hypothetical protein ACXABK_02735 [Candidatus Heimdallarchaeaceae archaeon]|jgi:uncharacterized membrane protein
MISENTEEKSERMSSNIKAIFLSYFAVLIIYGILAFVANNTNKWQILFTVATGCLTPTIGGFATGFYVHKEMKDWGITTVIFAGVVALMNLTAIRVIDVFSFVPFAPALVFAFAIACSLMGYAVSLPLKKRTEIAEISI